MPKRKMKTSRKASEDNGNGNGNQDRFEILREETLWQDNKHNPSRETIIKLSRALDSKRNYPDFISVVDYRLNQGGTRDGYKSRVNFPLSHGKPRLQLILKEVERYLKEYNRDSWPVPKDAKDTPKDAPKGKKTVLSTLSPEVIKTLSTEQIQAMASTYI